MNQDIELGIFLFILTVVLLIVQIYKNNQLEKDIECLRSGNQCLEDRIAQRDREGERNFKDLVAGIDGVTSVSLATKRYVELLKAENDLAELKEKVGELANG